MQLEIRHGQGASAADTEVRQSWKRLDYGGDRGREGKGCGY